MSLQIVRFDSHRMAGISLALHASDFCIEMSYAGTEQGTEPDTL